MEISVKEIECNCVKWICLV